MLSLPAFLLNYPGCLASGRIHSQDFISAFVHSLLTYLRASLQTQRWLYFRPSSPDCLYGSVPVSYECYLSRLPFSLLGCLRAWLGYPFLVSNVFVFNTTPDCLPFFLPTDGPPFLPSLAYPLIFPPACSLARRVSRVVVHQGAIRGADPGALTPTLG